MTLTVLNVLSSNALNPIHSHHNICGPSMAPYETRSEASFESGSRYLQSQPKALRDLLTEALLLWSEYWPMFCNCMSIPLGCL